MLGIFLIYFVGKAFYKLAEQANKNKWLFAVLGVISYYAGTFIAGVIFGMLIYSGAMSDIPDMALGLIAIPFGVLVCWGFYFILKRIWSKPEKQVDASVLDGDMMQ